MLDPVPRKRCIGNHQSDIKLRLKNIALQHTFPPVSPKAPKNGVNSVDFAPSSGGIDS